MDPKKLPEMEKSKYEHNSKHYMPEPQIDLSAHPKIKGYDFENGFHLKDFLESLKTTGFQASHLADAIEITKAMVREKATIYLGFTGNMISSGIREVIKYLVKNKMVHILVTNAGGIEEDIIKCFDDFVLGNFKVSGKFLFEVGVNRIGNIFVPNDRYLHFERFMHPFFKHLHSIQKKGSSINSTLFTRELGKKIDNPDSVLYWAYKNEIPVYCTSLIDGSIGDLLYYYKYKNKDFKIDITDDMVELVNIAINMEKTGAIILGAGTVKHLILNTNIFHNGLDFSVFINTGEEFDGSDSGAHPEEAVTWGKIKANSPHVKVHCDATIAFPLLVAGSFMVSKKSARQHHNL